MIQSQAATALIWISLDHLGTALQAEPPNVGLLFKKLVMI